MRSWVVGVVAASIGAIGIGVLVIVAFTASRDATAIVDLDVGDCFEFRDDDDVGDGNIESVDTVDCATPHLAEVVHVGALGADGPYPSDEDLFAAVERRCRDAGAVDSEEFGLLPIAPTLDLWTSFDGRFLCVAIPFGGEPVTGSARSR